MQQVACSSRLIAVLAASVGDGQPYARLTEVTYDGVPMELANEVSVADQVVSSIYLLEDARLPPPAADPYTVTIVGGEFGKIATVYQLDGIDQLEPIVVVGGSSGGNCLMDDPRDSVDSPSIGNWALTTVGTVASDVGWPVSGQIETFSSTVDSQMGSLRLGFKAGYLPDLSPGGFTIAWDMGDCFFSSHAVVVLRRR
jgi:hypothetical protein